MPVLTDALLSRRNGWPPRSSSNGTTGRLITRKTLDVLTPEENAVGSHIRRVASTPPGSQLQNGPTGPGRLILRTRCRTCFSVAIIMYYITDGINPAPLTGQRIDAGAICGKTSDDRARRGFRHPLLLARRCCVPDELRGPRYLFVNSRQLRRTNRENYPTKPYRLRWRAHSPGRQLLTSTSKTRSFTMILCPRTSPCLGR